MITDKHYVVFESPGTMFSETSEREIGEWSTQLAARMAADIVERHGARPYAFRFVTKRVSGPISDGSGGTLDVEPKVLKRSGYYHINGVLRTLDELEARADPTERILVSNMRCNHLPIVCETVNIWKSTRPFEEADFVVDPAGNVVERGDDQKHVAYRVATLKRVKQESGW